MKNIFIIKNTLFFIGDINRKNVIKSIYLLNKNKIDKLILTTNGGDVNEGLNLISYTKDLHIHINGYCMSMGCFILASGKYKTMNRNSFLMYHNIRSDYNIKNTTSKDLENHIEENNFYNRILKDILKNDFYKDINKDIYISSKEALKMNLIDDIIT